MRESERRKMADFKDFIGKRVILELKSGLFLTGYVHSIDASTSKISLQKVITATDDGKKQHMPGLKHFFDYELESINVLEEELKKSVVNDRKLQDKHEKGTKLLGNKVVPSHLKRMRDFETSKIELRNIDQVQDTKEKSSNKTSEYDSSSDPEQLDVVDAPYILLNKLDQRFQDAISYIGQQFIVGFGLEGVCPGREGKLCWLQFSTADHVFIFDYLSLGPRCFDEGIKGILEHSEIQKVMHDCRMPSDMLYHKFEINLVNVFDTQVADVFVYRLHHRNDWPRYVPSLAHCLIDHLSLEPDQVHAMKVRDGFQQDDQEVWMRRPASRDILMAIMKKVMYLRELRNILEEKMMAEFVSGVDIYLSLVKKASNQDAKKAQSSLHKLPLAFEELSAMMSHRDHSRYYRRVDPMSHRPGFRDNVHSIRDNNLSFCRDSPWHEHLEGRKFYDQYKSKTNHMTAAADTQVDSKPNIEASEMEVVSPEDLEITSADEVTVEYFEEKKEPVAFKSMKLKSFSPLPNMQHILQKIDSGKVSLDNVPAEKNSVLNTDSEDNVPVGQLIREALKHNPSRQSGSLDEFILCPAGKMLVGKGINDKTTRRRQRDLKEREKSRNVLRKIALDEDSSDSSTENSVSRKNHCVTNCNGIYQGNLNKPEWEYLRKENIIVPGHVSESEKVQQFAETSESLPAVSQVSEFVGTPVMPVGQRCRFYKPHCHSTPALTTTSPPVCQPARKSLSPSAKSIEGLRAIDRLLADTVNSQKVTETCERRSVSESDQVCSNSPSLLNMNKIPSRLQQLKLLVSASERTKISEPNKNQIG